MPSPSLKRSDSVTKGGRLSKISARPREMEERTSSSYILILGWKWFTAVTDWSIFASMDQHAEIR